MNNTDPQILFLKRCRGALSRMGGSTEEIMAAEALIRTLDPALSRELLELRDSFLKNPYWDYEGEFAGFLLKKCLSERELLWLSVLSTVYVAQERYEKAGLTVLDYRAFEQQVLSGLRRFDFREKAPLTPGLLRFCQEYGRLLRLEEIPGGKQLPGKIPNSLLPQLPELKELLAQARHPHNRGSSAWETERPLLTLLHFSDLHGAEHSLKEITEIRRELQGYLNDVLFTGDGVRSCALSGFDFWLKDLDARFILTVPGNHDYLNNPYFDWEDMLSQEEAAKIYIEPLLPFWGKDVRHSPGTCYYSKTYRTEGMLLIALDSNLQGAELRAELDFFTRELDLARQEDLAVVIAVHDPPVNAAPIPCNFNTPLHNCRDLPCGPGLHRDFKLALERFMDAGGIFTVFLAGHAHCPFVLEDRDFPRQRYLIPGSASPTYGSRGGTSLRLLGEESSNLANFVTFDRQMGLIKVIRAGVRRDALLRSQKLLVMDYRSGNILLQE